MKKPILMSVALAATAASPALAAEGEAMFSLNNAEFVVLIATVLFVAFLVYLKVPGMVTKMLDQKADEIRSELDEARRLREEAQGILASYERKQKEVKEHAEGIVKHAKQEADAAAERAMADLKESIARRLRAAEDQIASAEAAAVREVRDAAIAVAIETARDVITKKMTAKEGNALIDHSIQEVERKLH
ncbi:MAG: F0F1 ATP synthase subunit B [Mariprofundaceae bacterium]|nr:F0F1 ATP synthase subunit B [Mariprofundaceae bacterium]MDQ7080542.1 F0F1 ATP synthase subunit B [Paracoccaceae bacterium]